MSSWESINNDVYDSNIDLLELDCNSFVPKTPDEIIVMTRKVSISETEVTKAATNAENCNCCICKEPSFVELPESVKVCYTEFVIQ